MLKKAAAVKGSKENSNIHVTASGSGLFARQILEAAKEYNIEIKEDPNLAEVLSTLDIYDEIPEHLYAAVAEILSELYKINKQL